jgi:GNAT superfamily N-acetyltransferase
MLPDGTAARIRPIRSDGAERLSRAIHDLSPESRYQRFLSARAHYPPEQLESFVHCDGINCIGIVLAPLDESGEERDPVGVAHCLRDAPEADRGEVAIAVADRWQNRGVGRLLIRALALRCAGAGIRRLWGLMLAENRAARRLMLCVGGIEREVARDGRIELTVVLNSPDKEHPTCIDRPPHRE